MAFDTFFEIFPCSFVYFGHVILASLQIQHTHSFAVIIFILVSCLLAGHTRHLETAVLLLHTEYQVLLGCWLQEVCCQTHFHKEQRGPRHGDAVSVSHARPCAWPCSPTVLRERDNYSSEGCMQKGVMARAIEFAKIKLGQELILNNKRNWLKRDQL